MRRALLLVAVAIAAACTPPETPGTPSPSRTPGASASAGASPGPSGAGLPSDMTALMNTKPLPVADVFELAGRMQGKSGQPAKEREPVRTTPPDEAVGTSQPFWTYDFAAKQNVKITATLRVLGDHAKWWVQDGIGYDLAGLQQNAIFFDTKIYPTDRGLYGSEWTPGVDGDPRINVLVARIPGAAAGYFSSSDELPRWVNQYSAEREMVYLNSLTARSAWNAIIAHEFCHMIQYGHPARAAVWFDEGQAQLCEQANGFTVSHARTFLQVPDTQLNAWPDLEESAPSYGQAYLFLEFLRQHAGGDALINAFLEQGVDVPADMDRILVARGQKHLNDLYADFVAANAFIGSQPVDPAFAYPAGLSPRSAAGPDARDRVSTGGTYSGTVHQYAARYVELPRTSMTIRFKGATTTKLIPTDAHSGAALWWSDRADGLDSTLTRTVDLRAAKSPVLSFWTWYEIEPDYDYAYVAVSDDGGQRWHPLAGTGTTNDDPNGANLGNGFTGRSGGGKDAVWTKVEVDLSAYAGKQVQLRFEYVTDQGYNASGVALDDVEIPEIGFGAYAESDAGWTAEGFLRSANEIPQSWSLQLVEQHRDGSTTVRPLRADGAGHVTERIAGLGGDIERAVLVVSGLAPRTLETAPFRLMLRPAQ